MIKSNHYGLIKYATEQESLHEESRNWNHIELSLKNEEKHCDLFEMYLKIKFKKFFIYNKEYILGVQSQYS